MKTLFIPLFMTFLSVFASAADKLLTHAASARATDFILRTGRPLDQALYRFYFAGGSREAVIAELDKFQNEDGGFASCLEPDTRWRGSSPLGTEVALGILKHVGAPASDPHVQRAIRYLLSTFDATRGYWHAIPKDANSAPHARWWHFDESAGRCEVESPVYPTAAIAGHLRAYQELLPAGFLERITKSSLDYLAAAPDNLPYSDASVLAKFLNELPRSGYDPARQKMRRIIAAIVVRDPKLWSKYGPQPLSFVDSPDSPFYKGLEKDTNLHLDYTIGLQEADGGWPLNWSWESVDAVAWSQARQEWRGSVTLETLRKLKAFGRVEAR